MIEIPTTSELPSYDFQTTLDGLVYNITINYNERRDRWQMSIADSQNDPIISGIPLLLNVSLLGQYVDSRLPPGVLFVMAPNEDNNEAGINDLGTRIKLFYQDLASIQAT